MKNHFPCPLNMPLPAVLEKYPQFYTGALRGFGMNGWLMVHGGD